MNGMKFIFGTVIFFSCLNAMAWNLFGDQTYEECILENMKGVTSDDAAGNIRVACFNKTKKSAPPAPVCKDRSLSSLEMGNITGSGAIADLVDFFYVNVHNGNSNIELKSLNVKIFASNIKPPQEYKVDFWPPVASFSSGSKTIVLPIRPAKGYGWSIASATTCTF